MSGTPVEESLQSSNEKEASQSNAVPTVNETSGVEGVNMTAQFHDDNKENLIDNHGTEAVIDKDYCSTEQLDNINDCRLETSDDTSIVDKLNVSSDLESEESQNSGGTEIFVPPKEFCDPELDETNLISLDTTNNLPDSLQDQKGHLKNIEYESYFVDKAPVIEEASNLLDYNTEVGQSTTTISDDQEESNLETNEQEVSSENHTYENLIDLGHPLSDPKDSATNEVIQVANIDRSQSDNSGIENIKKLESSENTITFDKISVDNSEIDSTSATEKELQGSKQHEKIDCTENKNEHAEISNFENSILIQVEDDSHNFNTEKTLNNENNQFENIDPEVNIEIDNTKIPICQSSINNSSQQLKNENESSEIISNNYSESHEHKQEIQLTSKNENNTNKEISLDLESNSNSNEVLSTETKDINMTVNQLKNVQEENTVEFKIPEIHSNNEVSTLESDNQMQTVDKDFIEEKTTDKASTAINIKKEVETNSEENQPSDTVESFSVTKDEMSNNNENDISEFNCRSVDDNLEDSAKVALQKNEKNNLHENANLLALGEDSKLVHSELNEKTVPSSQKLLKEVEADEANNPIIVDNSNNIENETSVEDENPINKDKSLKIDLKNNSNKMNSSVVDTSKHVKTENQNLPVIVNKPENLINTLQGMKWLKSGQSQNESKSNDGNQITPQMKSLPKKSERTEENLFEGSTKKNTNKRRRGGNHRNDKAKSVSQSNSLQGKNSQNTQESKVQTRNVQMKNETSPSVWNSNTAKQLFPNASKESLVIDRIKEEENYNKAVVESICTAQQESERRKKSGTNLKIKILDEPDDDQWGKVNRNLPTDSSSADQCTSKGVIDKYGRIDGYTEKHMFMGKNGRRKEQEFLKSQSVNKPHEESTQVQSTVNKSQEMPIQSKPLETNVTQAKQSSRSESTTKSQNIEPKCDMPQATSKCQERPIHGRAGNEGPPGQALLQKPGFNQSTNKDLNQNVKQGQNFLTSQNTKTMQESACRNQQLFGPLPYRYQNSENNGSEKINVQPSGFTGYQDVKRQEDIGKIQSGTSRNQGNALRNQDQRNQNQSQCIKNQTNSNSANKDEHADQLNKGPIYSDQLNKNSFNNDSLKKNQTYTDRSGNYANQNQTCLKQNQGYSNRNSGQIENQAGYERNQGNSVKSQHNFGQNQNQVYSDKAVPKSSCVSDNAKQQQSNFSSNQGSSNQKQVHFAKGQNYTDNTQFNAYRDQEDCGKNENYYDKDSYSSQKNQNDYRRQDSHNRYQDKSQDRFRQGYTDNVTKQYDNNYNRVQNNSERSQGYQNYSDRNQGYQNYSDRSQGYQNNSNRNYSSRLQDSHYKNQNSDNSKGNYQNQHYSDRNNDRTYKDYDNYRGSQGQDNQQKNLGNYGKNQCYGNKSQDNSKTVKDNQCTPSMEENWDDDQSSFKNSQQVYNQQAIVGQDVKNCSSNILENKKISMEKVIGVQQTSMTASTTYKEGESSQAHMPSNKMVKQVQDINPEVKTPKTVDAEPKPNIVMAFDGNVNIQRALGLDPSTNYNQPTVSVSTASVSTTLSQLLNTSASQSLPLTQTSAVPANYDTAVVCTGGMMNVNAPPFNSVNYTTLPFSKDLEASFISSSLEVSEVQNPPTSRIANSSEEIMQAHKDVTDIAKKLAAAEAKLLALNVKFYNENMATLRAQNSATISNDGTIGEIQNQQQPQSRLPHPVADFVAMQQPVPQGFQVPSSIVQNMVTPVSFDASRNYTTDNMRDMPSVPYQLNAAFQHRLALQSLYLQQSGVYQPQTAASYQPQVQTAATFQPQTHSTASFQSQTASNYPQYNVDINAVNRLHRGSGTSPNSEPKDLRTGGHQFYN